MNELRVDYKDDGNDVVRKVNELLRPHGLRFVSDNLPHDGYEVYALTRVDAPAPPAGNDR